MMKLPDFYPSMEEFSCVLRFACINGAEFGHNSMLSSIDTCISKRHAISVTWEFGP